MCWDGWARHAAGSAWWGVCNRRPCQCCALPHSSGGTSPPRCTISIRHLNKNQSTTNPTPFPLTCSFLLQLALLDLECSGHAPSLLAASALSLSLAAYGKPAWPAALQQFGSYLEADLAPVRARLAELQAGTAAEQLRPIWRGMHEAHSYPEYDAEWKRAVLLFSCASRAHLGPAAAMLAGGDSATTSGTDSPQLPQPQDATAMLID